MPTESRKTGVFVNLSTPPVSPLPGKKLIFVVSQVPTCVEWFCITDRKYHWCNYAIFSTCVRVWCRNRVRVLWHIQRFWMRDLTIRKKSSDIHGHAYAWLYEVPSRSLPCVYLPGTTQEPTSTAFEFHTTQMPKKNGGAGEYTQTCDHSRMVEQGMHTGTWRLNSCIQ